MGYGGGGRAKVNFIISYQMDDSRPPTVLRASEYGGDEDHTHGCCSRQRMAPPQHRLRRSELRLQLHIEAAARA